MNSSLEVQGLQVLVLLWQSVPGLSKASKLLASGIEVLTCNWYEYTSVYGTYRNVLHSSTHLPLRFWRSFNMLYVCTFEAELFTDIRSNNRLNVQVLLLSEVRV